MARTIIHKSCETREGVVRFTFECDLPFFPTAGIYIRVAPPDGPFDFAEYVSGVCYDLTDQCFHLNVNSGLHRARIPEDVPNAYLRAGYKLVQ